MKKLVIFLTLSILGSFLFCQEMTAKKIAEEAVKKANPTEAALYVQEQAEKLSVNAEKRSAFAFLGSLYEATADYENAQKSYAKAAGIAASNAEGMVQKSNEELVLDAVRCALSAGDWENAQNYLNSAVRNSKSAEVIALVKLYEQWAALTKAEKKEDLQEPVALLKTYVTLDSMKSVKKSILFTLWYITGDKEYSEQLKTEFPSSMETEIINGKVQIYPSPFWYFLPR